MQSIRIFGKNYLVNHVDGFEDPQQLGSNSSWGEINVKKFDNKDFENEIILHETIHCIDEALDLDLTEKQVTALSTALFCVYRENKMHLIERPTDAR
jgi:hypothetical protein